MAHNPKGEPMNYIFDAACVVISLCGLALVVAFTVATCRDVLIKTWRQ